MPRRKRKRFEELEQKGRRKKLSREREDKAKKTATGEMASASSTTRDPVDLLTDPEMGHPASASLRAEAVTELQRQRGNVYVQEVMERIRAEKGSGRPLDAETRAEMEAAFGQDLGEVRVHTGTDADKLAKELGAEAFTSGKDIFFKEGAYQPGSEGGKDLLGHELTHVAQQSEASLESPTRITDPSEAAETEARLAAKALRSGRNVSVVQRAKTARAVARQEEAKAPAATKPAKLAAPQHLVNLWWVVVIDRLKDIHKMVKGPRPDYDKANLECFSLWMSIGSFGKTAKALGVPSDNLKAMKSIMEEVYVLTDVMNVLSIKGRRRHMADRIKELIGEADPKKVFAKKP
jgi:hypothetical protein